MSFRIYLIWLTWVVGEAQIFSPDGQFILPSQDPNQLEINRFSFDPPLLPDPHKRQTYFISASKKVRGGQPYKVHVSMLLDATTPLSLRASIRCNGSTVASQTQEFLPNSHGLLLVKMKKMLTEGMYEVTLEGHFKIGGNGKATAFKHRAPLELESRSVNIIIRTDKPIYRQDEMVKFRIIPLTPQLSPYHGLVDVFIYNPDGYLQRRYPAMSSIFGVVSISFQLGPELKFGNWKIRAQIGPNSQEIEVPVEEFNQPLFEVNLTQPITIIDSEQSLTGSVQANFTWGQTVAGNCSLEIFLISADSDATPPDWDNKDQKPSVTHFEEYFFGTLEYAVSLDDLRKDAPENNLDGMVIAVRATVSDYWYNETRIGYTQTKVYNSSLRLTFLGDQPQVFKPGMLFTTHLGVSQQDGSPLKAPSNVEVRTLMSSESGASGATQSRVISVPRDGIVNLEVVLPKDVSDVIFEALDLEGESRGLAFAYENANVSKTRLAVLRMQVFRDHIIQVTSSTRNPKVGEYIIFDVRATYFLNSITWILTSNGLVILSGHDDVRSTTNTFSVAIVPEMAPKAHLVVFNILPTGQVVADKFTFAVDGISRNKFTLAVNHHKDYYKRTFEVVVYGDPLAFIGYSAVDRYLYPFMSGVNALSRSDILRTLHAVETGKYGSNIHMMTFMSSDGFSDISMQVGTNSYGLDTYSVFDHADLLIFTDGTASKFPTTYCDEVDGLLPCLSGSCFKLEERCDGIWNCRDGTDEGQCNKIHDIYREIITFRRDRFNHIDRNFAFACCWTDGNISPEGHFIVKFPMPDRPAHYILSAISMSETNGLSVLDYHISFDSVKPFHMILETPETIHQGEQVGIRCALFNYYHQEMEILVILQGSEDYYFIEVDPLGVSQAYNARRVSGTIHHSVWVDAHSSTVVYMPIVPRKLGEINVAITATTQIEEEVQHRTINVIADGIVMRFHTCVPIDLTNKGTLLKLLDIQVTEDYIVPRQNERLFVAGSPKVIVTAVGDVFGPIFNDDYNSYTMLNMPHQGGEMSVFSFAMNLYAVDFLRRTNQLTDEALKKAFNALNSFYQTILNYQSHYGPFHQFLNETVMQESVWLTTFTVQVFEESRRLLQYADWEDYVYIDPLITEQSVHWILKHQNPEGSFYERWLAPFDRKMSYHTWQPTGWLDNTNITLTAQVVISLKEIESFSSNLGSIVTTARLAGVRYLERTLDLLFDPYETAIVTYALSVNDSPLKDTAFQKLDGMKQSFDGYLFWGKEAIKPPNFQLRNNQPYIQAHMPHKFESTNIAATAYALMVYNIRRSFLAERIAAWLNTQRLHNAGFSSTQDTFMALKALMHHSYFSNVREATDINITIKSSSSPGLETDLYVKQETLSTLQVLEIPNPWGSLTAVARGSGIALLQLDVQYAVDHPRYIVPPPVRAFDAFLHITYTGKNNSILIIKPCARWLLTEESPQSGMALIEVDIPSGYIVHQPDLEEYCGQQPNHLLRYAEFYDGKVTFFLDYLDGGLTCVEVLATRWYPVANLTRFLTVKVLDYYAPERFNTTIYEAPELQSLHICLVCGSFQCPYCPSYNLAAKSEMNGLLLVLFTLLHMLFKTFK